MVQPSPGLLGRAVLAPPAPVLAAEPTRAGRAGNASEEQPRGSLLTVKLLLVSTCKEHASPSQFWEHISDFGVHCCVQDWFSGSIPNFLQKVGTGVQRGHTSSSPILLSAALVPAQGHPRVLKSSTGTRIKYRCTGQGKPRKLLL